MAYQLSNIATLVQQRVRDTSYDKTEIIGYINDTQNDVFNEYRLPFMETTQSYTAVVGTADITNGAGLPSNFSQAIDLCDNTSGTPVLIPYKDVRSFDEELYAPYLYDSSFIFQNLTTVPPGPWNSWYMYDMIPYLDPAPSVAYTLLLRYYKKPTLLVNDTDVPSIPSQFQELLVVGAAYRVLQVKDNYDQAQILENRYQQLVLQLVAQSAQKQVGQPTVMRINKRHLIRRNF